MQKLLGISLCLFFSGHALHATLPGKREAVVWTQPSYPEKKWGPFAGGVGVAVWLNEFETENGTRFARSITLAPRRFRDRKTDEWRDGAYRPVDLPAILLAIQAAHDFCLTTPLPGEPAEPEEVDALADGAGPPTDSKPPF